MIIAGLIAEAIEIALAFFSLIPSGWPDKTFSVLFTIVIALGVWIEGIGSDAVETNEKADSDLRIAEADARAFEANQKAQEAILELARLREKGELTGDAVLATAEATKANALANTSNLATAEILALAMGLRSPEAISEVGKPFLIIPKVRPFAGKQFDASVTSRDINREALLNSLGHALKEAGWIEVDVIEQSSADHASVRGIRIDVDGSKDPTLLDAARALASALNAEGILAVVNPKPESDTANASGIRLLIGPKDE